MPKLETDQKKDLKTNTHNKLIYKLNSTDYYILLNTCNHLNLDYQKVKDVLKQTPFLNLRYHKDNNTTLILFPKDEFPEFLILTEHLDQSDP